MESFLLLRTSSEVSHTTFSICVAHCEESIYQARQEICSFALLFLPVLVNRVCRVAVITAQLELVYFKFVLQQHPPTPTPKKTKHGDK